MACWRYVAAVLDLVTGLALSVARGEYHVEVGFRTLLHTSVVVGAA